MISDHLFVYGTLMRGFDHPMAKLLDEAGIPLLLVGDSLGMVVLGYPDTTHVTMADMEHHVRAAARAKPNATRAISCSPPRPLSSISCVFRSAIGPKRKRASWRGVLV